MSVWLPPCPVSPTTPSPHFALATCTSDPEAQPSGGRRVPFGWTAAPVPVAGERPPVRLAWSSGTRAPAAVLRFTVACDDREEKRVTVRTAVTGTELGTVDVRFADPHQRFGLYLESSKAEVAVREGVALEVTRGTSPLWIFIGPDSPVSHRPCLLPAAEGDPTAELFTRLASLDSIQPFGWMEGCVLDALSEMERSFPQQADRIGIALTAHLGRYISDGDIHYEDPRSKPVVNRYYGIEATLPVVAIADRDHDHPAVRRAVEDWRARADDEGCVRDAPTTAEGCYTVAYPMAFVARRWKSPELAALARAQLLTRRERLFSGGALHLRLLPDSTRIYRDWARAYAWYLLGLVRTARVLDGHEETEDLWREAREVAAMLLDLQTPDGLWFCFVNEPSSGVETSGSAGIAAALALGCETGRFGDEIGQAARRAWGGLVNRLTPDGWLSGSSQANKGGEAFQRSGGTACISGCGHGADGAARGSARTVGRPCARHGGGRLSLEFHP
uniref:Glycosyl hydrolase family 88 n=1 Tax=Streptomyces argenteolus TaxID=67274 RepID=A9ZNU6_9ACTN|nr:hypothetical protein [Streptomyces argenteolus]